MKKYIIFALLAVIVAGCKEDKIDVMSPDTALISFSGGRTDHSFMSGDEAVLRIGFNLVGYPKDYDRTAKIGVLADSTTATPDQYEILEALVPANEVYGYVDVRVVNNLGEDFEDVRIWLQVQNDEEGNFQAMAAPVTVNGYPVYLTAGLVKPSEWSNATVYYTLGEYSPAYYLFIIEHMGESRFPMAYSIAGYNLDENGVAQMWTARESSDFTASLERALLAYNQANEPDLKHDAGVGKGQAVVVGKVDYKPLEE